MSENFIFDSTTLQDFLRCPRRYYWRHVRNLTPKAKPMAPSFGAAIHAALNTWYETHELDRALASFHQNWTDSLDDTLHTSERGEVILRAYVERYPTEPWRVLSLERTFQLPLPNGLTYCGRFDGVIDWSGTVLVLDHKTTSRLGGWYFAQFRPHWQFTGYVWASQQIMRRKCSGVLVNAIGVYKTKTEFARDVTSREDFEIEQFVAQAASLTEQIAFTRTMYPEPALMKQFPMNWTSCGDWGSCAYKDLCTTSEPERLVDLLYDVTPWSPLEQENTEEGGS